MSRLLVLRGLDFFCPLMITEKSLKCMGIPIHFEEMSIQCFEEPRFLAI